MTVNEAIALMQMMIQNGSITGNEPLGYFNFAGYCNGHFDEANSIGVECEWEDKGNVVYIE